MRLGCDARIQRASGVAATDVRFNINDDFEGEVVIGKSSRFRGALSCRSCAVIVKPNAKIYGRVHAKRVDIHRGARLRFAPASSNTPPVVVLAGVNEGDVVFGPVTPTFTVSDADLTSTMALLNEQPFVSGTQVDAEGDYELVVTGADLIGQETTVSLGFTIDKTPPSIAFTGPANGTCAQPGTTLTWAASDLHLSSVEATEDGVATSSPLLLFGEGIHVIEVVAEDQALNATLAPHTVFVDGTLPTISVTGIVDGGTYQDSVQPEFSADDENLVSFGATMDGFPFVSGTIVRSPGAHLLTVFGEDCAGNSAESTVQFVVENASPTIVISGIALGEVTAAASVTPSIVVMDTDAVTSVITLNGLEFSSGTTLTEEDDYLLVVTAVDGVGNVTTREIVFAIDRTSPMFSITAPEDSSCIAPPVDVVAVATDLHLASQFHTLNNEPFEGSTTLTSDGFFTLVSSATDAAGNYAEQTRTFIIDGAAPQSFVAGVSAGQVLPGATVIDVFFDEVDVDFSIKMDGNDFASGATIDGEGEHELVVVVTDCAGNSTTTITPFAIDKTEPFLSATGVDEGAFVNADVAITFGVTDLHLEELEATLNGIPYATGEIISQEGSYVFEVSALDAAGNEALLVRNFVIDKTAPAVVIIEPSVGITSSSSILVRVTVVDVNAIASIEIAGTPFAPTTGNEWTASVSLVEGANTFAIEAYDVAGNEASIPLAIELDIQPPIVQLSAIANGGAVEIVDAEVVDTDVIVNFSTTDENSVSIGGTVSIDGAAAVAFTSGRLFVARDGEEHFHEISVTATDEVGNETTKTLTFTIRKKAPRLSLISPPPGAFVDVRSFDVRVFLENATGADVVGCATSFVEMTGGVWKGICTIPDGEETLSFTVTADDGVNAASVVSGFVTYNGALEADASSPEPNPNDDLADETQGEGAQANDLILTLTAPANDLVSAAHVVSVAGHVSGGHRTTVTVNGQVVLSPPTDDVDAPGGGPFSTSLSLSTEGPRTITVVATDEAGQSRTLTRDVYIDRTPPLVQLDSPVEGALISTASVLVQGSVGETNLQTLEVNGVEVMVSGGRFSTLVTANSINSRVVVDARDNAGNKGTASVTYDYVSSGPVVEWKTPVEGSEFSVEEAAALQVSAVVVFAEAEGLVTLCGQPAVKSGQSYSATCALSEGPQTLVATATAPTGEIGQAIVDVFVSQDGEPEPIHVGVMPKENEVNVATDSVISMTFSDVILETSEGIESAFSLSNDGVSVEGNVLWMDSGNRLLFSPFAPLSPDSIYLVQFRHSEASFSSTFKTREAITYLSGRVVDGEYQPISSLDVTISGADGASKTLTTDEFGNWVALVKPGFNYEVILGKSPLWRALLSGPRRFSAFALSGEDNHTGTRSLVAFGIANQETVSADLNWMTPDGTVSLKSTSGLTSVLPELGNLVTIKRVSNSSMQRFSAGEELSASTWLIGPSPLQSAGKFEITLPNIHGLPVGTYGALLVPDFTSEQVRSVGVVRVCNDDKLHGETIGALQFSALSVVELGLSPSLEDFQLPGLEALPTVLCPDQGTLLQPREIQPEQQFQSPLPNPIKTLSKLLFPVALAEFQPPVGGGILQGFSKANEYHSLPMLVTGRVFNPRAAYFNAVFPVSNTISGPSLDSSDQPLSWPFAVKVEIGNENLLGEDGTADDKRAVLDVNIQGGESLVGVDLNFSLASDLFDVGTHEVFIVVRSATGYSGISNAIARYEVRKAVFGAGDEEQTTLQVALLEVLQDSDDSDGVEGVEVCLTAGEDCAISDSRGDYSIRTVVSYPRKERVEVRLPLTQGSVIVQDGAIVSAPEEYAYFLGPEFEVNSGNGSAVFFGGNIAAHSYDIIGEITFANRDGSVVEIGGGTHWVEDEYKLSSISAVEVEDVEVFFYRAADMNSPFVRYAIAEEVENSGVYRFRRRYQAHASGGGFRQLNRRTMLLSGEKIVAFAFSKKTGYAGFGEGVVPLNAGHPIVANVTLYPSEIDVFVERKRENGGGVSSLIRKEGAATVEDSYLAIGAHWRIRVAPAPDVDIGVIPTSSTTDWAGITIDVKTDLETHGKVLERPCSELPPDWMPKFEAEDTACDRSWMLWDAPGGVPGLAIGIFPESGQLSFLPVVVRPGSKSMSTVIPNTGGSAPLLMPGSYSVAVVGRSIANKNEVDPDGNNVVDGREYELSPPDFGKKKTDWIPVRAAYRGLVKHADATFSRRVMLFDRGQSHNFEVLDLKAENVSATRRVGGVDYVKGAATKSQPGEGLDGDYHQLTIGGLAGDIVDDLTGDLMIRLGTGEIGIECNVISIDGGFTGTCEGGEDFLEVLSAFDVYFMDVYLSGNSDNVLYREQFAGTKLRREIVAKSSALEGDLAVSQDDTGRRNHSKASSSRLSRTYFNVDLGKVRSLANEGKKTIIKLYGAVELKKAGVDLTSLNSTALVAEVPSEDEPETEAASTLGEGGSVGVLPLLAAEVSIVGDNLVVDLLTDKMSLDPELYRIWQQFYKPGDSTALLFSTLPPSIVALEADSGGSSEESLTGRLVASYSYGDIDVAGLAMPAQLSYSMYGAADLVANGVNLKTGSISTSIPLFQVPDGPRVFAMSLGLNGAQNRMGPAGWGASLSYLSTQLEFGNEGSIYFKMSGQAFVFPRCEMTISPSALENDAEAVYRQKIGDCVSSGLHRFQLSQFSLIAGSVLPNNDQRNWKIEGEVEDFASGVTYTFSGEKVGLKGVVPKGLIASLSKIDFLQKSGNASSEITEDVINSSMGHYKVDVLYHTIDSAQTGLNTRFKKYLKEDGTLVKTLILKAGDAPVRTMDFVYDVVDASTVGDCSTEKSGGNGQLMKICYGTSPKISWELTYEGGEEPKALDNFSKISKKVGNSEVFHRTFTYETGEIPEKEDRKVNSIAGTGLYNSTPIEYTGLTQRRFVTGRGISNSLEFSSFGQLVSHENGDLNTDTSWKNGDETIDSPMPEAGVTDHFEVPTTKTSSSASVSTTYQAVDDIGPVANEVEVASTSSLPGGKTRTFGSTSFDERGRPLAVVSPGADGSTTRTKAITYDACGVTSTEMDTYSSSITYESSCVISTIIGENGVSTTYSNFNPAMLPRSMKIERPLSGSSSSDTSFTSTLAYDAFGRIISKTSEPYASTMTASYDDDGRILTRTENDVTFTYTYLGNDVEIKRNGVVLQEVKHDDKGFVTSVSHASVASAGIITETIGRDGKGQETSRTSTAGSTTTAYDDSGYPETATTTVGNFSKLVEYDWVSGQLSSMTSTSPDGFKTTIDFSAEGQPHKIVTEGESHYDKELTYNFFGQVIQEVLGSSFNGYSVTKSYDKNGLLTSESLNGEVVGRYLYGSTHELISATHHLVTDESERDALGRVVYQKRTVKAGAGENVVTTQSTYEGASLSRAVNAGSWSKTDTFAFDARGCVTGGAFETPDGNTSFTSDCDSFGQVVSKKIGDAEIFSATTHPATGEIITSKSYDTLTAFGFHANGAVANRAVIGPGTQVLNETFDVLGRPLTLTTNGVLAVTNSYEDAVTTKTSSLPGVAGTYTRNSRGKIVKIARTAALNEDMNYDAFYQTNHKTELGEDSVTRSMAYDSFGRPTLTSEKLEGAINETRSQAYAWTSENSAVIANTGGSGPVTITAQFDGLSNLISSSGGGPSLTRTYDAVGNLLTDKSIGTAETKHTYAAGLRISSTFGTLEPTTFGYDNQRRLTTTTKESLGVVTDTYGANGLVSARVSTVGLGESVAFNAEGYPTSRTVGGRIWTYTPDKFGNVESVSTPGGLTHTYTYNALEGQLLTAKLHDGKTQTYAYDDLGRVTSMSRGGLAHSLTNTGLFKVADSLTGVTTIRYPDGSLKSQAAAIANGGVGSEVRSYDALMRLTNVSTTTGGTTASLSNRNYQYSSEGDLTGSDGNGITYGATRNAAGVTLTETAVGHPMVSYSFNKHGSLNNIKSSTLNVSVEWNENLGQMKGWSSSATPVFAQVTTYDDNLLPTKVEHKEAGTVVRTIEYNSRDALGRVGQISDSAFTGATDLTHDQDGRLTGASYPNGDAHTWTLRGDGSISNEYVVLATGDIVDRNFIQNTSGGVSSVVEKTISGTPAVTTTTTDAITSDARGRVTGDSRSGRTYKWDNFDNLMEVQESSTNKTSTYGYLQDGMRTSVDVSIGGVPSESSTTMWGMMGPFAEKSTGGPNGDEKRTLLRYGGATFGQMRGIAAEAFGNDALGSVVLRQEAGQTTHHLFGAWGRLRDSKTIAGTSNSMGPWQSQVGFTGHNNDESTGLVYMQHRYMDPSLGQFLSEDPVRGSMMAPMGMQGYTYANASPMAYTDPDGRFVFLAIPIAKGLAVLGGFVAAHFTTIAVGSGVVLGTAYIVADNANEDLRSQTAQPVPFLEDVAFVDFDVHGQADFVTYDDGRIELYPVTSNGFGTDNVCRYNTDSCTGRVKSDPVTPIDILGPMAVEVALAKALTKGGAGVDINLARMSTESTMNSVKMKPISPKASPPSLVKPNVITESQKRHLLEILEARRLGLDGGGERGGQFNGLEGMGGVAIEKTLNVKLQHANAGERGFDFIGPKTVEVNGVSSALGKIQLKGPYFKKRGLEPLSPKAREIAIDSAVKNYKINTAPDSYVIDTRGLSKSEIGRLKTRMSEAVPADGYRRPIYYIGDK
ncbi:MAG: hypothetical protein GY822_21310 [Deltaproteobacteria bacterium]|nr:hypothetical protein [Deltaproteobacteria bacterium]